MKYRHVKGFGRKTRKQMIETGQDPGMEMTETKRNQACRGHKQRERQSEKHVEGRTKRKVSNQRIEIRPREGTIDRKKKRNSVSRDQKRMAISRMYT